METQNNGLSRVITIPNILTVLRILMIPLILWLDLARGNLLAAAIVLIVSGATDIVDGFIARHYHMVSNVGRILDPLADKLTQLAVLACLCVNYDGLLIPLAVLLATLIVKELVNGIIGLIMMQKNHDALDSKWHGKATTVWLYITIFVHLAWTDIPTPVSIAMIILCLCLMILSFVLYTVRHIRIIRQKNAETQSESVLPASDPEQGGTDHE